MKDHLKKALELADKYLSETPKQEVDRLWSEVNSMPKVGPTLDEYLNLVQDEFVHCDYSSILSVNLDVSDFIKLDSFFWDAFKNFDISDDGNIIFSGVVERNVISEEIDYIFDFGGAPVETFESVDSFELLAA